MPNLRNDTNLQDCGVPECTAVAAIQLRMRMRILTRPENSLANFSHQISNKKLRVKHCEGMRYYGAVFTGGSYCKWGVCSYWRPWERGLGRVMGCGLRKIQLLQNGGLYSEELEEAVTVDFEKHPARKVGTRFRAVWTQCLRQVCLSRCPKNLK